MYQLKQTFIIVLEKRDVYCYSFSAFIYKYHRGQNSGIIVVPVEMLTIINHDNRNMLV